MTTEQMKSGKVRMRLDACMKFIKEMGPASAKQVSNALGYGNTWALPFLKMGVATGELMVVRNKRPQLYDLPPEERGVKVQRPHDATPTEYTTSLPKYTILTLEAIAYMFQTPEEHILQELIIKEANRVTVENKTSLDNIIDEKERHEKQMKKLRKGYK
jgi:hypothetical protein